MEHDWQIFRLRYMDVIRDIHRRYPDFWTEFLELVQTWEHQMNTIRGNVVQEFPSTMECGIRNRAANGRTMGQRIFGVGSELQEAATQTIPIETRSVETQTDFPPHIIVDAVNPVNSIRKGMPTALCGRGRGRISEMSIQPDSGLPRPYPKEALSEQLSPWLVAPSPCSELSPAIPGTLPLKTSMTSSALPIQRKENRDGLTPNQPVRQTGRKSNVCWNCHSTGHRYSNCPLPRDRSYCYGCGHEGVTLRTCPDCSEEWKNLGPHHPDRGPLG